MHIYNQITKDHLILYIVCDILNVKDYDMGVEQCYLFT